MLEVVDCCASCKFMMGWYDNMGCGFVFDPTSPDPEEDARVRPYNLCDHYARDAGWTGRQGCEPVKGEG